jgi:hypothetical protein
VPDHTNQRRLKTESDGAAAYRAGGVLHILLMAILPLLVAAISLPTSRPFAQTPSLLATQQQGGTVRALVVGIDNYKNSDTVPQLGGAVADAQDIHQALRRAGVSDMTLLIDSQANRAKLGAALSGLVSRTGPRDLVIITFAGHGSQDKEHIPNSEPDHLDEFFVLWGFGNKGADTRERFLDDEMFDWLGKLASKGAQTIFVADVCHGGGLSKAPDLMAGRTRLRYLHHAESAAQVTRGAYFIAPGDDQLMVPPEVPAEDDATRHYPSLTFIAGADDHSSVGEVDIPGFPTPRGATSYAFARAIEGGADQSGNRDGVTTRTELMAFLDREIGKATNYRQPFIFEPRDLASAATGLFDERARKIAPTSPAVPTTAAGPASLSPVVTDLARPIGGGNAPSTSPTLKYVYADQMTGNVVSRKNGIVAYGISPDELDAAAERFEAEERFAELRQDHPLELGIKPRVSSFVDGERFAIIASGLHGRHLIMMNLVGSGEVQYLFPRGDVSSLQTQDSADFTIEARAPFGSDAMVVIATQNKRPQLEAELQSLDGKVGALKAWNAVASQLGSEDRLGVVSYRTRARN